MELHDIYDKFPKEFPLPFVLDGATGTSLIRDGMPQGVCSARFVLDNPGIFKKIQRAYADAGSDAVLTPTFDGNRVMLRRHGMSGGVSEYNLALASLSGGNTRFIGGDMSTTGLFIEPAGDTPFEDVVSVYAEQAAAISGMVDFFFVETMINLSELRAAVTGIKSVSDKPVFVSLTVDKNGHTISGDALIPSLITLAGLGVSAFGCNCSVGPQEMIDSLKPVVPYSLAYGIPLIAKPNAGVPHTDENGRNVFDVHAGDYSVFAAEALENGITVLGGCCGSDGSCVAAIRKSVGIAVGSQSFLKTAGLTAPADIRMLCATNRVFGRFDPSVEPVDVTEDISDDFGDCGDDVPLLRLAGMDNASQLLEASFAFDRPFALCGDSSACALVMRRFNGKSIFIG